MRKMHGGARDSTLMSLRLARMYMRKLIYSTSPSDAFKKEVY